MGLPAIGSPEARSVGQDIGSARCFDGSQDSNLSHPSRNKPERPGRESRGYLPAGVEIRKGNQPGRRWSVIADRGLLGISIGELFESSGDRPADLKSPFRLLAEQDALRVLTAFSRTTDLCVRRAIARLVETVADLRPAVKPSSARPATVKPLARRRRTADTQAWAPHSLPWRSRRIDGFPTRIIR